VKILIAEDDAVSRRILEAKLVKWGYDVIVARDGHEAAEALAAPGGPRLAILDWMMPGRDGVDVCREVRKRGAEPYTYLILLTAQAREEDLVRGMDAGADDYIVKPFKSNELRVRLRAGRRIIDLQQELIAARETLRTKAARDPLTGLWNHEEILRQLGMELERARRTGQCVGVIMIDLDDFKGVNDSFGHLAGDAVLRAAADVMRTLMRSYDTVGRYGGDEFLVVMPNCSIERAETFAERLRAGVGTNPVDTSEGLIPVSMSLGAAVSRVGAEPDVNALVQAADQALYNAKHAGRNRVHVVDGPAPA
jgi:diguanylate cyclase (GGDEF)-like protein